MKRVTILVNPLSGGVGPQAADEAEAILSVYDFEATVITLEVARIPNQIAEALEARPDVLFVLAGDGTARAVATQAADEAEAILSVYDFEATVITLEVARIPNQIAEALEARPDVLFVLAGDGTARAVATQAGPKGPLIAPLPGGTMNMLPKALYGTGDWKLALRRALEEGAPQAVSGGVIEGEAFYCAAILGAPALWAPAREAMRTGKLKLAWMHGRRAFKRAFSGHIRFSLDGGVKRRAEALVLISPMISKAMDEPVGLEAAAMNTSDAAQAFRLAAHALFDDWRHDPNVTTQPARWISVSARSKIPAVIDGEPMLLGREASVTFLPRAFMALAPKPPAAEDV